MLYMTHNFIANYHSADGAGDEKMKEDMIMSEIAKMIVHYPHRVVMLLRGVGVKIKSNPSRATLVAATTEAMHNSPVFAKEIMLDIVTKRHENKGRHGFEGGHWAASGQKNSPNNRMGCDGCNHSMTGAQKRGGCPGGVWVMNQATGKYECKGGGGALHRNGGGMNANGEVGFSRYYGGDAIDDSAPGADPNFAPPGSGSELKKKGIGLNDISSDIASTANTINKTKDLVKKVGDMFGGLKKHKAKVTTNPQTANQYSQQANVQKQTAQDTLNKKVDAVAAGSGMKSHIGRNILIGVGVALGVGAIGWGIYHFRHVKKAA